MSDAIVRELFDIAHESLVESVIPGLTGGARYQALMVARVLAIASRHAGLGAEAERQEFAGIEALAGEAPEGMEAGRALLCTLIRSGRFDAPASREALMAHLTLTTENRLRIDNPKALARP